MFRQMLLGSILLLCAQLSAAETGDQITKMATLDQETQSLKKAVLDLNRELFMLEEELLYPANTQVAVNVTATRSPLKNTLL